MFTIKTKKEIVERANGKCDYCYSRDITSPHHCFFLSEYFKEDKNDEWNGASICQLCHDKIHHLGNGKHIEVELKRQALERYVGKYIDELRKIFKKKSYMKIDEKVEEQIENEINDILEDESEEICVMDRL